MALLVPHNIRVPINTGPVAMRPRSEELVNFEIFYYRFRNKP